MILKELKIHSFGKLRDKTLTFADGLTIIFGSNEAGKTTVFSLVDHLLNTSAVLPKRDMKKTVNRWFPADGGDTLAAELKAQLEDNGGSVHIYKRWGESPEAKLQYAKGGIFTNQEKIAEEIRRIWGLQPETARQVCLFPQNSLSDTLPELQESKELINSLSDILQKSLVESGGVSISGFIETVREQYAWYFSRWNRETGYPEGNKGIEGPWKKNVGPILEAWYEMKNREKELGQAKEQESVLLRLKRDHKKVSEELDTLKQFLQQHENVYSSAGQRRELEAELRVLAAKEADIKKTLSRWDECKIELDGARKEFQESEEKRSELKEIVEKEEALRNKRSRVEKYRQLLELKTRAEERKEELAKLFFIPADDFKALAAAHRAMQEAELKLQSGRLRASIRAKENLRFTFAFGVEGKQERDLIAGNSMEIDGEGAIHFENDSLALDIYAGSGEYETLSLEFEENQKIVSAILKKYAVASKEEAEDVRRRYTEFEEKVRSAEQNFLEACGDVSFEALEKEVETYGNVPSTEDTSEALKKFGMWEERFKASRKAVEEAEQELAGLTETYGNKENVYTLYAGLLGKRKGMKETLSALPDIPSPFTSAEDFTEAYRSRQKKGEDLQREQFKLEKEIVIAENEMPDESLEDLEVYFKTAERRFKNLLREGETLGRILQTARDIQEEIQKNPYGEFQKRAENYIQEMMSKEVGYGAGKMKTTQEVPPPFHGTIVTETGQHLGYEQLSAGTKDAVALAVRLAMADYYLDGKRGFLLLDDPLVEMDPGRQKASADVLTETAQKLQMVLFTCHPGMCDLFPSAEVVELL